MAFHNTTVTSRQPDVDNVSATERVLLQSLVGLRWASLAVIAVVLVVTRDSLERPELAVLSVAAALCFTAWATYALRHQPTVLLHRPVVAVEAGIAVLLQAGDGWVYGYLQSWEVAALASVWPLAAVMTAGLAFGWRWGAAVGALVALSRLFGLLAPDVSVLDGLFDGAFARPPPRFLSVVSNLALYCLAGAGIGHLSVLQRRAERQESTAKAREELARGLHDGVLQTLALVQRQASDPSLVQMARDTDRELRTFLYGPTDPRPGSHLAEALTASAHHAARRFGIDPTLVLDPDLPELDAEVVAAAAGAVSEALANAAKHAGATHVTVYAGIEDDEVLVSVHDDGRGIDLANVGSGSGIASSIQARITDAGGRAEVRSSPGQGTEVCLWLH